MRRARLSVQGGKMAPTKEQIEKQRKEALARAEKRIVKKLQFLVDSSDFEVTVCRPTASLVWVVELCPPPAGTARSIHYRTEKVRRAK
jgi:hypothetical protein